MKFLKITQSAVMEFVLPLGDASQEEIDEAISENGKAEFLEAALAGAKEQAAKTNGKVLEFDQRLEVVEV